MQMIKRCDFILNLEEDCSEKKSERTHIIAHPTPFFIQVYTAQARKRVIEQGCTSYLRPRCTGNGSL